MPALMLAVAALTAHAQRPMKVEDLFSAYRVGGPQVSRLGDVAYQVAKADPKANKITTKIWFKASGQASRELDLGPGSQSGPRFSPDGKRLAYQAGGQIWVLDLASGTRAQVTKLSGGAAGPVWSPDGQWLAFASTTVPSGDDAENAAYLKAQSEKKPSGRHYNTLMYRHWMDWRDTNQFSHLFVAKADGSEVRDLTKGLKQDVPNAAGIAHSEEYTWSPDGKAIAFGAHAEFEKATSTNGEIYEVTLADGRIRKVTDNPAADTDPAYSPDGKYLAWRAQRTPGFESDKWEIRVQDRSTGKLVADTKAFDRQVESFVWNGSSLVLTAGDGAHKPLFTWEPGKAPRKVAERQWVDGFALTPDGRKAVAALTNSAMPADLFEVELEKGATARLTTHNLGLVEEMKLNRGEDFWVKGAPAKKGGKAPMVHALVIKPVGYDPSKKYPVAFILHGGPQGVNGDQWHQRWNLQSWAGRGFLVVAPNPRGSTGFGQQFTDEISGDWSGLPIQDMLAVLDGVHKKFSTDPKRVVAAGGSYGGYAVNWLAGHHADRFAAFVSHAGIFNALSMQLASEEMWFPHHEFKGFPWESPAVKQLWEKHSPHNAYATFKKPILVVHGELDYRVAYTEALQLYNIHKLRNIPAELLVYPDEGHFVAKPANSLQWYETVMGWCERWVK